MTTKERMTSEAHLRQALVFLEESRRELESGDILQGSEKLWGAACHADMAVALQRGWPHGQHRAMVNAAERLARKNDEPLLAADFSVAEKFHANSYHDFMEDYVIAEDRVKVERFVRRIVEIAGLDLQ